MYFLTRFLILYLLVAQFFIPVSAQKQEIFLRKVDFELKKISPVEAENKFFLTLHFNKNITYKFFIKNQLKEASGEAVVEIYDGDRLFGTNYVKNKYFNRFVFVCSKTGMYDVVIRFKDNSPGSSEIEIYMIP